MLRFHQLRDQTGRPITLGVRPAVPDLGTTPGVTIVAQEDDRPMVKATEQGHYVLDGVKYKIAAGDAVPEGGKLVEAPVDDGKRKKGPAPENRAEPSAPESRSAADTKAE